MAYDLGENEIIFLPSYFISSPKIVKSISFEQVPANFI